MIREVTLKDNLQPLAESWQKTCNADDFNIKTNIPVFINELYKLILNPQSVLLGIDKDFIVGIMGITIFNCPLSNAKMANEHFWYVMPEHRKGLSGMRLLKQGQEWAKNKGCSHFLGNASMLASDLHDNVCSFYKSLGMKKFETTYIMSLGG